MDDIITLRLDLFHQYGEMDNSELGETSIVSDRYTWDDVIPVYVKAQNELQSFSKKHVSLIGRQLISNERSKLNSKFINYMDVNDIDSAFEVVVTMIERINTFRGPDYKRYFGDTEVEWYF